MAAAVGSAQDMVRETLRLIDEGVKEFKQVNLHAKNLSSVILVGETGTGKSALINLIAEKQFRTRFDDENGRSVIEAVNPLDGCKISHDTNAETSVPRRYEINGVHYWDMPGLNDNRGPAQEIANASLIQRVFRCSREVKILFVATEANLDHAKALPLLAFAEAADQLFLGQVEKIEASIALVVTKASQRLLGRHCVERILKPMQDGVIPPGPQSQVLKALTERPICVFKTPENEGDLDTTGVRNEILRNLGELKFAPEVEASTSVSQGCRAIVNDSYNQLHRDVADLVRQFTESFAGQIGRFADEYSKKNHDSNAGQREATRTRLEALQGKIQAVLENEYSVDKIPDMVRLCQEIASDCGGSLDDNLGTIRAKINAMTILESFTTSGIKLPLDVVNAIHKVVRDARVKVGKALIQLTAKDNEEIAQREAKRAEAENQRFREEEVKRRKAEEQIDHLERQNAQVLAERQEYVQQCENKRPKRDIHISFQCSLM